MNEPRPRLTDTGPPVGITEGPAWLLETLNEKKRADAAGEDEDRGRLDANGETPDIV